jgi:hypothetical protein
MNHDGAFGCECGHMNAVDDANEDNHESSSSISICLCRLDISCHHISIIFPTPITPI